MPSMSQSNQSLPPNYGNGEPGGMAAPQPANATPDLQGFNWGAFLMSWMWAIGNGVWVGLLGLLPFCALPVGLLLGIKGNEWSWKAKQWPSVEEFRRRQRIWTIVGIAFLGLRAMTIPFFAAVLFPVFARARENAKRSECQAHLHRLSFAVLQFAADHQGHFPTGKTLEAWKPQLQPYLTPGQNDLYECPSHPGEKAYQINPALDGRSEQSFQDPATGILIQEPTDSHLEGSNTAYVDGHIKWNRDVR